MEGYKKILVPLDGSKRAEAILSQVEKVAAAFEASISLLTVVHMDRVLCWIYSGSFNTTKQELQTAAVRQAQEYLRGIEERLKAKGFSVESHVRAGDEAEEILDHYSDNDVDLIAMCTRGRSGVECWLVGSVAERVLRHATKPIFLLCCDGEEVQAVERFKGVS